jgi:hypothetical protein
MLLMRLQAVSAVEQNPRFLENAATPAASRLQLAAADVRQLSSAAKALQEGCTSINSRLQRLTDMLVGRSS